MKKLFSLVLALAMVLSLSVTAFAAGTTPLSQDTSSGGISVQGRIVPQISATVAWGDMQFTYYEANTRWDANNTNGVSVTNTTVGRSIDTSYSYARNNDKGETSMTAGWEDISGTLSNPGVYNVGEAGYLDGDSRNITTRTLDNLGTTLASNENQQFWLTFTTNAHVSDLTQSFAQVGTLTVTIAAV